MNPEGPLDLVVELARILDELGIPYAVGGSVASSFFGEPRSTADVDVAISVRSSDASPCVCPASTRTSG